MEEKIKAKLEELRTGLQADGGDLELVKIEGKVDREEMYRVFNMGIASDTPTVTRISFFQSNFASNRRFRYRAIA